MGSAPDVLKREVLQRMVEDHGWENKTKSWLFYQLVDGIFCFFLTQF